MSTACRIVTSQLLQAIPSKCPVNQSSAATFTNALSMLATRNAITAALHSWTTWMPCRFLLTSQLLHPGRYHSSGMQQ
jgi:hypothetical protein